VGPSGHCFVVGAQGSFRLEVVQSSVRRIRLLAILDESHEKEVVYDRFGMKWSLTHLRSRWKNTWLGALLAHSFNPLVDAQVSWSKPQPYGLDELKACYLTALEPTGKLQTAAPGPQLQAQLKGRIREAQTFDELIEVHRAIALVPGRGAAPMAVAR